MGMANLGIPMATSSPKTEAEYRAHNDLGSLLEAHRIRNNPVRLTGAVQHATSQRRALRAVSGPRAEGDGNY